jgi:uncharacterized RDD family membrane protein YckC
VSVRPYDGAVEAHTAGIVTRSLAAAVDLGVVLAMMGSTLLTVAGLRFLWSPLTFRWPSPSWTLSLLVGAVIAASYLTVAWAVSGRSFGAAVLGLRVRSRGGGPIGWTRAAMRAGVCVAFPPGLFWCVPSRRRLSVADILLRTAVVYDWADAGLPDPVDDSPGAGGLRGATAAPP